MPAIDGKIADQEAFVDWWDNTVRLAGRENVAGIKSADHALIEMRGAEAQSGVSQQQVSRWRKSLADKPPAASKADYSQDASRSYQVYNAV